MSFIKLGSSLDLIDDEEEFPEACNALLKISRQCFQTTLEPTSTLEVRDSTLVLQLVQLAMYDESVREMADAHGKKVAANFDLLTDIDKYYLGMTL